MEVQSVLTRSPLLLTVTSMDGAAHTLPAEPSVSAAALRDAVCQRAGITDTFGWAIYIAMYNKVASLGHGENYVLDAVSQCEQIYRERQKDGPVPCRLYLRKEVLAPWPEEEENSAATDLVYAQVCRGLLLHEYVCQSDLDLAVLAAEQYYVEFGVGAAGPVGEADVAPLLPAYVPASERSDTDRVSFWCRSIATAHRQLFGGTADRPTQAQVKQDVVSFARRTWPRQLSAMYEARAEAMAGDTAGPGPGSGRRRVVISSEGVTVTGGGQQRHVTWAEIAAVTTDVGFARQKRSTSDSGGEQSHAPAPPSTSAGGLTSGHGSGTVTFLLYGGGKAGAPAAVRLQTGEAGEVAGLVVSGLAGLTRRSRWAVALQGSTSAESLQYRHGDLLHLEAPISTGDVTATARRAGPGRAGGEEAGAGVERDTGAGDSGTVLVNNIHVLPCVDRPAPAVLRLFQKQKGLSAVARGPHTEEDPPTDPLDSPPSTPPAVSRTKTFPSHRHQGLAKALASLTVGTEQVEESGKPKDHVNEKVNLNESTEELDAAVRFINGSIQQIDKGATADDAIDQLKERVNIEDSAELVDGRVKSRDSMELVIENVKPEGSGEVVEGEGHLDDEDDQTVHNGDFG